MLAYVAKDENLERTPLACFLSAVKEAGKMLALPEYFQRSGVMNRNILSLLLYAVLILV